MKLLLFNLAVDERDQALGFSAEWIEGLARRMERIRVITMREGEYSMPPNVSVLSVGGERGYSEPRRALVFYRHLFETLREERPEACFSHMNQVFSALAGPALRIERIPLFTWYVHRQGSGWLRAAHFFSDGILTSSNNSYPYKSSKVLICGHGINTELFSPAKEPCPRELPLLISVGRLSPIKNHGLLIEALKILKNRGINFKAAFIGDEPGVSSSYTEGLKEKIRRLGLEGEVELVGSIERRALAEWYRNCSVHLNASPPGLFDKSALEAMSCGKPSLVCNEDFSKTMGIYSSRLIFRQNDARDLAEKMEALLKLSSEKLEEMGIYLRNRVVELHGLDRLMDKLVEVFSSAVRHRR